MTSEEIHAAAKAGTEEALKGLSIGNEQHFVDHQFIKGVRDGIKTTRKGGLIAFGASIVGLMGWALKSYFTVGGTP